MTNDKEQMTNDKIRFQIEDTGIGMTPEVLKKIFLPFEQVGNAEKQAEVTGLGLAISQKVLTLMGSTIKVKSQLGVGSVFWFEVELPEVQEWTQTPNFQPNTIIGFEGEKRKILVVDDHWENRSVLVNLLEPIGFEVFQACNGQDGLDQAFEFQPDLIITDLTMPVMNGLEMTQHLRASAEFQNAVIIATSASVFDWHRQEAQKAGCNDFIPKPVQAQELFLQLQNYLQLIWIYQKSGDRLITNPQDTLASVAEMVIPSSSELVALYQAVQGCDIADIQLEANHIKQLNAKYTTFADQVRLLADEFEVEAIAYLINAPVSN